jgi:hypothetical protein
MSQSHLNLEEILKKRDQEEKDILNRQKQADFFNLHFLVKNHMGWDDVKTKNWFYQKNTLLGNFTPLDYYGKQPAKCINWIHRMIEGGYNL